MKTDQPSLVGIGLVLVKTDQPSLVGIGLVLVKTDHIGIGLVLVKTDQHRHWPCLYCQHEEPIMSAYEPSKCTVATLVRLN